MTDAGISYALQAISQSVLATKHDEAVSLVQQLDYHGGGLRQELIPATGMAQVSPDDLSLTLFCSTTLLDAGCLCNHNSVCMVYSLILTIIIWPRGPMDKASAHGAGDCRFESCRGQSMSCCARYYDSCHFFRSHTQPHFDTSHQLRGQPGA